MEEDETSDISILDLPEDELNNELKKLDDKNKISHQMH